MAKPVGLLQSPRLKKITKTVTGSDGKPFTFQDINYDQHELDVFLGLIHSTLKDSTTVAGSTWYNGSAAPVTLHNDGDYYLRTNGDIYLQVGSEWVLQMNTAAPSGGGGGSTTSSKRYLRWMQI
jgi:hypothetical protein